VFPPRPPTNLNGGFRLTLGEKTAYIMYTSGSTGTPKPVAISTDALSNYCHWVMELARDGCGSPIFGSLAFDHSITLIWPNLMSGKRLVLLPGIWDLSLLMRDRPEPFSLVKATPSHLRIIERLAKPDYSRLTRVLMFGGEQLYGDLVAHLRDRLRDVTLVNHFGPTECTVGCVAHTFVADDVADDGPVPIGLPVWNTAAYVLPHKAAGTEGSGELAIVGVQVCLPSVGQSTDQFPDSSALGKYPGRAYRTGDLVAVLANGGLAYLGRVDGQLKVNGIRLEAQEVRHVVCGVQGVYDAIGWVNNEEVQRLFVDAAVGSVPEIEHVEIARQVARRLREHLPSSVAIGNVSIVAELAVDLHGKRVRPSAQAKKS